MKKNPDVVAISCTMTFNVSKVKNLVNAIRSFKKSTPIIVGGYPFNLDSCLWEKIGADACSCDFESAYAISEELYSRGNNDAI